MVSVLLLAPGVIGSHPSVDAAEQAADCARGAPLTASDVEEWLRNRLPEVLLSETLASCGATFILDPESAQDLRTLGASEELIATLAPPENLTLGQRWTPLIDRQEMVWIPAGTFLMGSPNSETGRDPDEEQHQVEIPSGFWLDVEEVTNQAYQQFLLANPEWHKDRIDARNHDGRYLQDWTGTSFPTGTGDDPVVYVSWSAAQAYADWARKRLPTEAEWEYAARAGTRSRYWWGDDFDQGRVRTVRSASPNSSSRQSPWGIVDMIGGIWEWTSTIYSDYPHDASDGREMPDGPGTRVVRGGYWASGLQFLRVANRSSESPVLAYDALGFRCAR